MTKNNNRRSFVRNRGLFVAVFELLVLSANASPVIDDVLPLPAPSNTDLLQTSLAASPTISGSFSNVWSIGAEALYDGVARREIPTDASFYSEASIDFTLDTSANISGYDVTRIETTGGWVDDGRDRQSYSIYYTTVSAPSTWISIGSVDYEPASSTWAHIAFTLDLKNVLKIRLEAPGDVENGWFGLCEIDVFGTPSAVAAKVLEWKLDEENGLIAHDSVGTNDGDLVNFPDVGSNRQWVPGLVGNCLFFDERVHDTVENLSAVNLPTDANSAWSINMYVLVPDGPLSSWTAIGGFGSCSIPGVGKGERSIINFDNGIYFWGEGADLDGNTLLDTNRWQMLTATYDGTTLRLYKNGSEIASGTQTFNNAVSNVKLGWAGAFNGMIDEFTIWDDCLSQPQIDALASIVDSSMNPYPVPYSNLSETAPLDIQLSWDMVKLADSYDVYLGVDFNSVFNADHSSPEFKGNQASTSYTPPSLLDLNQVYYWRIDPVNGVPAKGDVLSFKTTEWIRSDNMTGDHTLTGPRVVYTPGDAFPYKMWLWGWPSLNSPYYGTDSIYLARSQSLDSGWQFYKGNDQWDSTDNPDLWVPVVTNGSGNYNNQGNGDPDVTKYGDYYYMAYSAVGKDVDGYQRYHVSDTDGSLPCVMFAKSLDGINWSLSDGPILIYEPEIGNLEDEGNGYKGLYHMPSLLRGENSWRVWFHFWDGGPRTGYAECVDPNDPLDPSSWSIINGIDNELDVPSYPDVEKIGGEYYSFITNYYYGYSPTFGLRELNTTDSALSFDVADYYIPTDDGFSIERPSAIHMMENNQHWVYVFYSALPYIGDSATIPHPIRYMKKAIDMPYATGPNPADGLTNVGGNVDLSWTVGDNAISHDVYLGADFNALINADYSSPEFMGNQTANTYVPLLAPMTTYYWAVDEVDNIDVLWGGAVWSFTTGRVVIDETHFVPSNTDLLQTSLAASPTISGSFSNAYSIGAAALYDGQARINNPTDASFYSNASIDFTLDTSANTSGYNIYRIETIGGWVDDGRDRQSYSIYYTTVSAPDTWILVDSVDYDPASTWAHIAFAVDLKSVYKIRFEATADAENGWFGLCEIDVFGTANTEPVIDETQFVPSDTDLLQTSLAPNPVTGGSFSNVWSIGAEALFDGVARREIPTDASFYSDASIDFTLDISVNTSGYDINGIETIGGWVDDGRDRQSYSIYYTTVSAPSTWICIGSVDYEPASTWAHIDFNVDLKNVYKIRLVASSDAENGWFGLCEIDVFGAASTLWTNTTSIANGDFEIAGNNGTFATGWSGLPAETAPRNFAHASAPKPGNESLGSQFVYVTPAFTSPSIGFQTLTSVYQPDQVYQFQGYTVDPGSLNRAGFELGYDDGSGFVSLAVATYDVATYASWTMVEGVTFQTPSSDGPVGQNIIVRIRNEANGDGGGVWFDGLRLTVTPLNKDFKVVIMPNAANPGNYDFVWNSQSGFTYDLVTATDLSSPISTWAVWDGKANLLATSPTNTLTNVPGGGDPRRFFAVVEKAP